jgi:hypothetical protein
MQRKKQHRCVRKNEDNRKKKTIIMDVQLEFFIRTHDQIYYNIQKDPINVRTLRKKIMLNI